MRAATAAATSEILTMITGTLYTRKRGTNFESIWQKPSFSEELRVSTELLACFAGRERLGRGARRTRRGAPLLLGAASASPWCRRCGTRCCRLCLHQHAKLLHDFESLCMHLGLERCEIHLLVAAKASGSLWG